MNSLFDNLPEPPALRNDPAEIACTKSGAIFSDDMTYRYVLWRVWGTGMKLVHICGLNPSTADARLDDPTIRREIGFCSDWGFDGLVKTNAFAFRATDPLKMIAAKDPIGPKNDDWITFCRNLCQLNVAAWGTHIPHLGRDKHMLNFGSWQCFGKTQKGHPKHPLYLPKGTELVEL